MMFRGTHGTEGERERERERERRASHVPGRDKATPSVSPLEAPHSFPILSTQLRHDDVTYHTMTSHNIVSYDAIFFDGADEWMEQGRHTWAVASNVPKGATVQDAMEVMMVRITIQRRRSA